MREYVKEQAWDRFLIHTQFTITVCNSSLVPNVEQHDNNREKRSSPKRDVEAFFGNLCGWQSAEASRLRQSASAELFDTIGNKERILHARNV